jgi:hypothetical protein
MLAFDFPISYLQNLADQTKPIAHNTEDMKMRPFFKRVTLATALLLSSYHASADVIVLDFEGVNATHPSGYATVEGFYNGGTSSDGTTGTNYGIEFTDNALAICLNTTTVVCSNTSRGGLGNPSSQLGALFFLDGSETFMNVSAGFTTGFSFLYTAIFQAGSVSVFDGLGGTGNLLASLALPTTASACSGAYSAGFCPFVATGIGFAGTAKSVSFAGVANQIVFDDITFGSVIPDPAPTPEPETLFLLGAGLVAMRQLHKFKA